jgi:hypothetical protein
MGVPRGWESKYTAWNPLPYGPQAPVNSSPEVEHYVILDAIYCGTSTIST